MSGIVILKKRKKEGGKKGEKKRNKVHDFTFFAIRYLLILRYLPPQYSNNNFHFIYSQISAIINGDSYHLEIVVTKYHSIWQIRAIYTNVCFRLLQSKIFSCHISLITKYFIAP